MADKASVEAAYYAAYSAGEITQATVEAAYDAVVSAYNAGEITETTVKATLEEVQAALQASAKVEAVASLLLTLLLISD
jgi:hypothetical protein